MTTVLIFAYVIFTAFAPYFLIGALARIVIPRVKPNPLALLGALLTIVVCEQFDLFFNVFRLARSWEEMTRHILEQQQSGLPLMPVLVIAAIGSFLGTIAIPFLLARGGIEVIDRVRRRKKDPTTGSSVP